MLSLSRMACLQNGQIISRSHCWCARWCSSAISSSVQMGWTLILYPLHRPFGQSEECVKCRWISLWLWVSDVQLINTVCGRWCNRWKEASNGSLEILMRISNVADSSQSYTECMWYYCVSFSQLFAKRNTVNVRHTHTRLNSFLVHCKAIVCVFVLEHLVQCEL